MEYSCVLTQSCPALCNPMDQAPLYHEILQARILEWIAVFYSKGSFWPRNQTQVSCTFCAGRQILYHCATREAYMEYQGTPNSQNNSEKEEQSWRPPSFWLCAMLQSSSDQTVHYRPKVQYWPVFHLNQWNRIETPEVNLPTSDPVIFDKGSKIFQ